MNSKRVFVSRRRRLCRFLAAGFAVLALLILAAVFAAANYLFGYALDREFPTDMFSEKTESNEDRQHGVELDEDMGWLRSVSGDVYTENDGLRLHGYLARRNTDSGGLWAVAVHGYKASPRDMAPYARHYYDKGWNVLVPDQRAHGLSEGRYIGMGCLEKDDMLSWIRLILSLDADARILFHGVSMGAATVMMLSGENLPPNVCLLIEDCGYASVADQFGHELKKQFGLPAFPILPVASLVTGIRAGWRFPQADSVDALRRCAVPVLFIHGSADDFVPFSQMDIVYDAKPGVKERFAVEGAGHARSLRTDPEAYWECVDGFIAANMTGCRNVSAKPLHSETAG